MSDYNLEMQKLYSEIVKSNSDKKETTLPVICPTTFNKPCRLCDLAKTILFRKDNEGTPIRQKASELNRKKSYYSNVIFPTNPSEIVIFQYGETVWKELMLFSMAPGSEVRDWLDPRTGRNVIVTKTIVGGNKRRTQYSTKSRINASPLLDMAVLKKLSQPEYQLDNIIDLIKSGKIKVFYQSLLQDGQNELRFLPSWLGPGITKFFHLVLYHYGVTDEEFDMIQKGELNPFAGLDYVPETGTPKKEEIRIYPEGSPGGNIAVGSGVKSLWDTYIEAETHYPKKEEVTPIIKETEEERYPYPPCFGKKWDPTDSECVEDCKADGWAEACQKAFDSLQRSSLEKRKVAKRLMK